MPASVALLVLSASDGIVVITSITLVFLMLVALCLIVTGEGKLFDLMEASKQAKKQRELDDVKKDIADRTPQAAPVAPAAPAPVVENGIPGEVVAAIAAAVYYLEGDTVTVQGIRRLPTAQNGRRRGAWGDAGVAQNVRPF